MSGRHRVQVDGDVVAGLTWWGAILAGLALLGASVHEHADRDAAARGIAVSVPDTDPADHGA